LPIFSAKIFFLHHTIGPCIQLHFFRSKEDPDLKSPRLHTVQKPFRTKTVRTFNSHRSLGTSMLGMNFRRFKFLSDVFCGALPDFRNDKRIRQLNFHPRWRIKGSRGWDFWFYVDSSNEDISNED
jgi:hypothetical protein